MIPNIDINLSGPTVATFHKMMELLRLPVDKKEQMKQLAGRHTLRVIRDFQKKNQLPVNEKFVADEPTIQFMIALLRQHGYLNNDYRRTISGIVKNSNEVGLSNIMLAAIDVDLKGVLQYKKVEVVSDLMKLGDGFEFLGLATSDQKGFYEITFYDWMYAKSERRSADVVVFAVSNGKVQPKDPLIGRSELFQNVGLNTDGVDIIVQDAVRKQGEYKLLLNQINSFLKENKMSLVNIYDSQEQISFIAAELYIDVEKAQMIVLANALNHNVKENLEPELLYGLGRQKITLDWESLQRNSVAVLTDVLKQATEERDIDSFSEKIIAAFIDSLKSVAAAKMLEPQGDEPNIINELLTIALSNISERVAYIKAIGKYTGSDENEFWNIYLPEQTGFKTDTVRSLRAVQKIFYFSGAYLPVVNQLAKSRIKELSDLAQWDLGHWQDLVKKTGVPSFVNGENENDKANNYATLLRDNVNNEFYTEAVRHKIITKAIPIENKAVHNIITDFLSSSKGFDLKHGNINDFKNDIGNEDAVRELKELQRMLRINPDTSLIPVLRANGLTSALKIAEYDSKTFGLEYGNVLGGTQKALIIYQNAAITNANVSLVETGMMNHLIGFIPNFTLDPAIFDRTRTLIEERFPGYSKIFNVNLCECRHCNSVYSPAAYFVELMRFLQKGTTNDEGQTPSDVFKKRRPDLFHLPLTCENSNTLIPYIDLVNEVMENYIFYTFSDATDADFMQFKSADIGGASEDELRAQAQHIKREAYRILAEEAVFPSSLPFNLPLEILNAYSRQLGLGWYNILKTTLQFEVSEVNDNTLAAAGLGFSEMEFAAITRQDFEGGITLQKNYWDYYGFPTESALNGALAEVPVFLERTGLQYTEMIALFQTNFINSNLQLLAYMESIVKEVEGLDGSQVYASLKAVANSDAALPDEIIHALNLKRIDIGIFMGWIRSNFNQLSQAITLYEETSACDISDTVIKSVANLYESPDFIWTESLALNINAFLRLWRKSNWSMARLDTVLQALDIGALNPENLRKLEAAYRFIEKTATDPQQAAVLWGNMGYWHTDSLYPELFLTKSMEINPVFVPQPGRAPFVDVRAEDAAGTSLNISNNIADIQAVFNVAEADLITIFQHAEIDLQTADISLSNISIAYRYIVFSNLCDTSIPKLIDYIRLFELEPFGSPQDSLNAYNQISAVRNSNFTIPELGLVFNAASVDYQDELPETTKVDELGLSLQHKYEEINNREIAVDFADVEATRLKLKQTFTYNALGEFLNVSSQIIQALAETEIDNLIATFNDAHWVALVNNIYKSAVAILKFELTDDEAKYYIDNPSEFEIPNLKNLTHIHWLQLHDYVTFRENLQSNTLPPISIFEYASQGSSSTMEGFTEKIREATGWAETDIRYILSKYSDITGFRIEKVLLSLQEVITLAKRMGISPESLFKLVPENWDFNSLWEKAQTIKRVVKSKYSRTSWNTVATKLNDPLREKQRDSLVAYLLSLPIIKGKEIRDANGLYEFFLIDVQMNACMDTSRIVQASAAIQQFVNRIHLNLEKEIAQNALDRNRWKWMKYYRVWEAQMRIWYENPVYLNPEWRMDKSEFFKTLESHLAQNDITERTAEEALRGYLKSMDEVANLNVAGMYEEKDDFGNKKILHVFGHTHHTPYKYYYRTYNFKYEKWSAWNKVDAAIQPVVDSADGGKPGVHLIPVVWKNRLLLFWPEFMEKAEASKNSNKTFEALSGDVVSSQKPKKYWEVKLAWSELYDGKWTAKQLSKIGVTVYQESYDLYTREYKRISLNDISFKIIEKRNELSFYLTPLNLFIKVYRTGVRYVNIFTVENISNSLKIGGLELQFLYRQDVYDSSILEYPNEYLRNYSNNFNQLKHIDNVFYIKPLIFGNSYLNAGLEHLLLFPNQLLHQENPIDFPFFYSSGTKTYFVVNKPTYVALPVVVNNNGLFLGNSQISDFVKRQLENARIYIQQPQLHFSSFHHPFVTDFISNLNKNGVSSGERGKPGLMESDTLVRTNSGKLYDDKGDTFKDTFDPNFPSVYKPTDLAAPLKTYYKETIDFAASGANSKYNWELFFHAPLYIATQLSKNGKFEEALKWFHHIFDPTTDEIPDWGLEEVSRFWKVKPFKYDVGDSFEQFINDLTASSDIEDPKIAEWRDNPFNPHLVAANFPVNYKKHTLLAYVENIVEWADSKFRKFTRENVYEAIQLYVMASHILGPKPPFVPSRGSIKKETFASLDGKLNDLNNARVEMENSIGFSSGIHNLDATDSPAISGTGLAFYFCVPPNEKLLKYWEMVEDRLYKIRNCKDINGIARRLALFAPPIDPALLVKAQSAGLDLDTILSELNAPNPHYRFAYLLQKANEFCSDVKGLGNALLSAIEKQDGEALSRLRSTHEIDMLNMIQGMKERQVLDARLTVDLLEKQRVTATSRFSYYNETLLGNEPVDIPNVIELQPNLTDDIQISMNPSIQEIVPDVNVSLVASDEGGVKFIPKEREDIEQRKAAMILSTIAGATKLGASIASLFPTLDTKLQPFGVGVAAGFGGQNVAFGLQFISEATQTAASTLNQMAGMASTFSSYIRREQEWTNQANVAIREIEQLEIQMLSAGIRLQVAEKDLENHKRQIENATRIESYLKDKFTSNEFYGWMKDQLTSLHKQSYDLAFEMAKKVEMAFEFEKGIDASESTFIDYGYFDNSKSGLLAGEKLQLALRQMEVAYQEKNQREFEITKHISIAQLDPLALVRLRATGVCDFEIPEVLYDIDHAGHFFRRIKSVSISLPCIAGPYTSISSTLSLKESKYRKSNALENYPETGPGDTRFNYNSGSIQSIASSNAQNDSGVFELNFHDERYLPFEGSGAISSWRLEMPTELRQFDYNSITDVVLHIKYTAREGGSDLQTIANAALRSQLESIAQSLGESGLHIAMNMKHDLPNEWHLLINNGTIGLIIDKSRLPFMAQSIDAAPEIETVTFIAKVMGNPEIFTVTVDSRPPTDLSRIPEWQMCSGISHDIDLGTSFSLSIDDTDKANLEELMLVVKYKF